MMAGVTGGTKRRRTSSAIAQPWAAVLKGVLFAVLTTVIGVILLALLAQGLSLSDGTVLIINQILKALSILVGVWVAFYKINAKYLINGAAIGVLYTMIGLVAYVFAQSRQLPFLSWVLEMIIGAGIGALGGIFFGNIKNRA